MKKLFLLTALLAATVIGVAMLITPEGPPLIVKKTPAFPKRINPVPAPIALSPAPSALADFETALIPTPAMLAPDPREEWLDTLYESASIPDRLDAARQLAAQCSEASFLDLATFIAAAEADGEESLLRLAKQVAAILGQMRGKEVAGIATELAYGSSPLVAEAAVNAAIAAEPIAQPQQLIGNGLPNLVEQRQLEDALQRFVDQETDLVEPVGK